MGFRLKTRYSLRPPYRAERFQRKRIDLKILESGSKRKRIHIVLEWTVENSKNASK